ncbi:hypothetical protein ACTOV4_16395 [Brucella sp. C7-11G]
MASTDCIAAVKDAAQGKLNDEELASVFEDVQRMKDSLIAEGKIDRINERLREAIEARADENRVKALLQTKHAAMNAIIRDRLSTHIASLKASGLNAEKAILALFEGSPQGVALGRVSVHATKQAFETKFVGGLLAEIERDKPYLIALRDDADFSRDVVREMVELKQNGKSGRTGNTDAVYVAKAFAKYAELSRTELNRLGANIGKMDGWAGPQRHDDLRMSKATPDEWIDFTLARLDVSKTFSDAKDMADVRRIMGEVYEMIITGQDRAEPTEVSGQALSPANMAKSLGKNRVLHFRDADAWLDYNSRFGSGNIFTSMISHQSQAAHVAAQMQIFGPNPENMLATVLDAEKRLLRDDKNTKNKDRLKLISALEIGQGGNSGTKIAQAMLEMKGLTISPTNRKLARISQDIRTVQSLGKLGGAVLTAMPTDVVTAGAASMFRGGGFWKGVTQTMGALLEGHSKGEQRELTFLLGEGFDGAIAHVASPHIADDGVPGALHRMSTAFFKWNGLTGWTDRVRGGAVRSIAAEMAMRAASDWNALPAKYSHVLKLNGITPEKWQAIRHAKATLANGNSYITPDAMMRLPDNALERAISARLREFKAAHKNITPEKLEGVRQRYFEDMRRELELDVSRFFADETSYAVVETDAASRRISLRGTRPGTFAGEAMRFIMQFKGFPVAFTQRVAGRALYGAAGDTKGQRFLNNLPHTGTLMAGLAVAGYMSLVSKDASKGRWPPRNPMDLKVWLASIIQGGGFGIYGDFLFGEANRFGNGPLETAAGPFVSDAAKAISAYQKAKQGEKSGADWLNLALGNTPFINLFYVRPAMDTLFLNSLREVASPGYRRRQETRLRKEYGQKLLFPQSVKEITR